MRKSSAFSQHTQFSPEIEMDDSTDHSKLAMPLEHNGDKQQESILDQIDKEWNLQQAAYARSKVERDMLIDANSRVNFEQELLIKVRTRLVAEKQAEKLAQQRLESEQQALELQQQRVAKEQEAEKAAQAILEKETQLLKIAQQQSINNAKGRDRSMMLKFLGRLKSHRKTKADL
jgi:hypothetical protein